MKPENPISLKEAIFDRRLKRIEKTQEKHCGKINRVEKLVWVHNGVLGVAILLLLRLINGG